MALLVRGEVADGGLCELLALEAEEGEGGHVCVVLAVDALEDELGVADVVAHVGEGEVLEVADAVLGGAREGREVVEREEAGLWRVEGGREERGRRAEVAEAVERVACAVHEGGSGSEGKVSGDEGAR